MHERPRIANVLEGVNQSWLPLSRFFGRRQEHASIQLARLIIRFGGLFLDNVLTRTLNYPFDTPASLALRVHKKIVEAAHLRNWPAGV